MNIFSEKSYKSALKKRIRALRVARGRDFSMLKVAAAARIQPTFLSRVFNESKAHLSSDQLFLALRFLECSSDEHEFVTLLHEYERSGSIERQAVLKRKLARFRRMGLSTQKNLDIIPLLSGSAEHENIYFLDPEAQALHLLFTLSRFSRAPMSAAQALGLSRERYQKIVRGLIALGVIELQTEGRIKVLRQDLHLSADSPIFPAYRRLMRTFATERLSKIPAHAGYTLSVLVSADEATRLEIQELFLSFLQNARKRVQACEQPDRAYQMVFDLFPLVGNN